MAKKKKKVSKKKKKLVSMREYARMRGVSDTTVQEAVLRGKIPFTPGKGVSKMIDPEEADAVWNTSHANSTSAPKEDIKGPSYQQSRAIREAYQARIAKIEYELKSERLIEAEQVKREAFEIGRRLRDALMNIPQRIAPELASMTNAFKIEQYLADQISEAIKVLKD